MKRIFVALLQTALIASLAACAADSEGPAVESVSAAVTANAINWVVSCHDLALRSCNDPNACASGANLTNGIEVMVWTVDYSTRLAHLTVQNGPYASRIGYSRIDDDGNPNRPYISAALTGQCF